MSNTLKTPEYLSICLQLMVHYMESFAAGIIHSYLKCYVLQLDSVILKSDHKSVTIDGLVELLLRTCEGKAAPTCHGVSVEASLLRWEF